MIHRNEHITTPIIPSIVRYYTLPGVEALDLKAICCFAATGFFLDDDTYYINQKAFRPATSYSFNEQGAIEKKERYFNWHHAPREITFSQALEEFTHLLESIVKCHVKGKKVIIPISGGLDSRTLAAALCGTQEVQAYSYSFHNGLDENFFGQAVAGACNFPFTGYTIPKGYLWPIIEEIAQINGCYSEFTNPRQMAVLDKLQGKGDLFLLGHWGDVLFDDMGASNSDDFDDQATKVKSKILKKRGVNLAQALWEAWGLEGTFEDYLDEKVRELLKRIDITDPNARIRAFKSLHWATRWTSTNLAFFNAKHEMLVPYFDNDMCKFVCKVPETFLAGRQIQIGYLKAKSRQLASIPWQKYHPCNLYNYGEYTSAYYLPFRIARRLKIETLNLFGKKMVGSNWQLQFLGAENDQELKKWLFENTSFSTLVPRKLAESFYDKFRNESEEYHHSISMLLTLSLFSKLKRSKDA